MRQRADQLSGPSQCSAYLRASEYYRQAFFFLRHDLADPRLLDAYRKHVECFEAARPELDITVEACSVQTQDRELKGFFYRSGAPGEKRPTVLLPCGYDSPPRNPTGSPWRRLIRASPPSPSKDRVKGPRWSSSGCTSGPNSN